MEELKRLADDGLTCPPVGPWGEEKYKLVSHYAALFAKSMRNKWDTLVYIDLFSGSGRSKLRYSQHIIPATPLLVLNQEVKFDKYIFCEKDKERSDALVKRVNFEAPNLDVKIINEDCNVCISDIANEMPRYSKSNKVLSFCFVDPFTCKNIYFNTIRGLSEYFMDFLVLIPSGMDANRNYEKYYLKDNNHVLDNIFGSDRWRREWHEERNKHINFEQFAVHQFSKSMEGIGYIDPGIESAATIRSDEKNLLLYRLMLYSRHKLGNKFWDQTRKYINPQRSLFT